MAQISEFMDQDQNLGKTSGSLSEDQPKEGKLTKKLEKQTAKIPSSSFLAVAVASGAVSLGLQVFSEKKTISNFVGLWVPTLLLIGIYNKLVKIEGSDMQDKQRTSGQAAA